MTLTNPTWADAAHTQITAQLDGETIVITAIPGLLHYDEIIASGVAIAPYVPPPVTQVTQCQARLALLNAGLLTAVQTAVNAAAQSVQVEWEYAAKINITDPLVDTIANSLTPPLTQAQIQQLFNTAATLTP